MSDSTFLTRVVLTDYKSIAACDVRLGSLMFLVGPNAAGKSNFLDGLKFVSDALQYSLDHAFLERAGGETVCRRTSGPCRFGIRLEFVLPTGTRGHYAIEVTRYGDDWQVDEECVLAAAPGSTAGPRFRVHHGTVTNGAPFPPAVTPGRLYLAAASGLPEFRPVYDALSAMRFYNLDPAAIAGFQPRANGDLLSSHGHNLAHILEAMERQNPPAKQRLEEYLGLILPGLVRVEAAPAGPAKILRFLQNLEGLPEAQPFWGFQMSDGTLRALGILVALFQSNSDAGPRVSLVGIEDLEAAIYPAAMGVLLGALQEASNWTQVLVTSHSPELLDDKDIPEDSILAVAAESGVTRIGPLGEADRSVLRDRLFTAGELLRAGQLTPAAGTAAARPQLFDGDTR